MILKEPLRPQIPEGQQACAHSVKNVFTFNSTANQMHLSLQSGTNVVDWPE